MHAVKPGQKEERLVFLSYTSPIMPKDALCAERVKLEQELIRAVNAIYSASKEETDAARLARLPSVKP